MTGPVIVAGAGPTDEGAVLLMQDATASVAVWTAEPWTLALPASKGPLLLKLDDLCLAVAGDGDLGSAQATSADDGVVFQELTIGPLSRPG